jgi:hypothetical protein
MPVRPGRSATATVGEPAAAEPDPQEGIRLGRCLAASSETALRAVPDQMS